MNYIFVILQYRLNKNDIQESLRSNAIWRLARSKKNTVKQNFNLGGAGGEAWGT
jgi:hypothetical protein